jgi:hypothetical protein
MTVHLGWKPPCALIVAAMLGACSEPGDPPVTLDAGPRDRPDAFDAQDTFDRSDATDTPAPPDVVDAGHTPDGATTDCASERTLRGGSTFSIQSTAVDTVDLLFMVDNSASMEANGANLAANLSALIDTLTNPPRNSMTGEPQYAPVRDLHVGVVSSDLGTPGSVVPSCASGDNGDDGLLNPTRNGLALRTHPPWTTAPAGRRPVRCTTDRNQYPSFLTFDAARIDAAQTYQTGFREDFVCVAYLSTGGCELEQQLESVYRALVVHNPRATPGNTDPNAGFVRDEALLAILMITDEEDGSVRDCRYAEVGVPCTSALSVFDRASPDWSSSDLNLRFYLYTPGSAQDPTWALDRYIDPMRPTRGFTSLKPAHPERVIFSAIAGVPINLPITSEGAVNWTALLGSTPDGSNGYMGMSPEGPVSMRQRNLDAMCPTRVVPACRREGSAYDPAACTANAQYFAWPSRRIAEVARRFAVTYNTGSVTSICKNDYSSALAPVVERVQGGLSGRCLLRAPATTPPVCAPGQTSTPTSPCASRGEVVRAGCAVREILPTGMTTAACTAARGRTAGEPDPATGRATCVVNQVSVPLGGPPPAGQEGFYVDTRPDPQTPACSSHIEFTTGGALVSGASATVECLAARVASQQRATTACGVGEVGASCAPLRPAEGGCNPEQVGTDRAACFYSAETYVETGSPDCASGVCLVHRFGEATLLPAQREVERRRRVTCSCRCAVPPSLAASVDPSTLCACPTGFVCREGVIGAAFPDALRGSYCVPVDLSP